jgi:phage terminase large subunit
MKLTKKQTKALDYLEDQETNELLFGGGAGGAKSVLGCYWILKSSLKYPGTRWVIGRAVLKTLKETTLNTLWWVCSQQNVRPGVHFQYYENKGLIRFPNGSEILLKDLESYPSDPNFDELGSLEITGAFVDECNQIVQKAWDILKSRIRYRLDEYGIVPKILGTCNPAKNWVYSRFYSPYKLGTLKPSQKFIQSLLNDNPNISKHYYANLQALDRNSKERLLFGNWEYSDDPTELCEYDAIQDLFTNDHVEPGIAYISADLAMKGRDRFIVGLWEGYICSIPIDKLQSSGKEIETDIKNTMLKGMVGHSRTVVDSDGMGSYLESYLTGIKEFHGGARAYDHKEYGNLKSECAYKLAELVNKRQIKIKCNPDQKERIIEELGVLKADDVDADEKKKRIIKKEVMKEILGRSPDYLDMLIMRMLFAVKPEGVGILEVPR